MSVYYLITNTMFSPTDNDEMNERILRVYTHFNSESIPDDVLPIIKSHQPLFQLIRDSIIEGIDAEKGNIIKIEHLIKEMKTKGGCKFMTGGTPSKIDQVVESLKHSIKLSTTKMSLLSYIYNGNKEKVIEKKLSLNKRHLTLLEAIEENNTVCILNHNSGKKKYLGHKTGENYRQMGENIRRFNIMISNLERSQLSL